MDRNEEVWAVCHLDERFLVSSHGRIIGAKGKELIPQKRLSGRKKGYWHVAVGRKHKPPIHVLVTRAFYGELPKGLLTRHLDGNKDNNHLDNLRYGTISENNKDSIRHGTSTRGELHPNAKLTFDIADKIRAEYKKGDTSTYKLARKYNTSPSKVYRIIKNRSYVRHSEYSEPLNVDLNTQD